MKRLLVLALLGAIACLALPASAGAAFGLESFEVSFVEEDGSAAVTAGSHPYAAKVSFAVNTKEGEGGEPVPDETIKDLYTAMPAGFIGDLTAVPPCSDLEFIAHPVPTDFTIPGCSEASVVGKVLGVAGEEGTIASLYGPVYLLESAPGTAAKLGFWIQNQPITFDLQVNELPPYNVIARLRKPSQMVEIFGGEVTIWGNPASPVHDEERGRCYEGTNEDEVADPKCPAGKPEAPFLTLPRACIGPLAATYEMDSWQNPGVFTGGGTLVAGMEDCGDLLFGPQLAISPTSSQAESPAGLEVEISVSDDGLTNPTGRAQSDIRDITTILPPELSLSPSAAEGLGACTSAKFAAEKPQRDPATGCPESSKLGTIEAQTPILGARVIEGSLYAGQQEDPAGPFGAALYLVLREPELGIFVKQAGEVSVDQQSGQIRASFEDLPQFPLSHVSLRLREGPRAPLITPASCGTHPIQSILTPWSGGQALPASSSFTIGSGPGGGPCPSGPAPLSADFEAGSQSNAAGAFSPFSMRITRPDATQPITRLSATLPSGVVPKLAGVGRCPEEAIAAAKGKTGAAEQASPSCPSSSRIGTLTAGAGIGGSLTFVQGAVYLAGPFAGDPLSAVTVVPALAGPFDLGTVVNRVGLTLNPTTYLGEVDGSSSEPIPTSLKGIPLRLRDLRISVDRPNFTLNPTGCEEEQSTATISGPTASQTLSARYQAASCASLGFKPKLTLRLKGGTKRTGHPALRSTLLPRPGNANIGRAVVTLPASEFIDQAHISNPCTRVQFNEDACPTGSVLGTAIAHSPLLDEPLAGPVYFRSNGGERQLPDIVADLHGLIDVVLLGEVTSKKRRLRTTFSKVPDTPVSRFELNLFGGKRGLLVNNTNLCSKKRRFSVAFTGQNGRLHRVSPVLGTSCGAGGH